MSSVDLKDKCSLFCAKSEIATHWVASIAHLDKLVPITHMQNFSQSSGGCPAKQYATTATTLIEGLRELIKYLEIIFECRSC